MIAMDKLEQKISDILPESAIKDGTKGMHGVTRHLDFYVPERDVYIEVSAAYTPRKIEQLSRAENVIYIQGEKAVDFICDLIKNGASSKRPVGTQ